MKCNRMKWIVLDWNTKAVEFYNKIGGEIVKKWLYVKLDCSKFGDLCKEHVTA